MRSSLYAVIFFCLIKDVLTALKPLLSCFLIYNWFGSLLFLLAAYR